MIVPEPKAEAPVLEVVTPETILEKLQDKKKKKRISWAKLLKRIFNIDIETCPHCGGKVKIIAAIEDPKVIKKILGHVGIPSKPPSPWPVRGPPKIDMDAKQQDEFEYFQSHPNDF